MKKLRDNTSLILGGMLIVSFLFSISDAFANKKLNPFKDTPDNVAAGKLLYNSICYRCHGSEGDTAFRERDLRRFNKKYTNWGENPDAIFLKTLAQGRLRKGMPSFPEKVANKEIWKIKTYINSIQNK